MTGLSDEAMNRGRADVASLNRWFRSESPVEKPPSRAARPPLEMPPHHKVLVSVGGATSQARIHINAGKLAGTQIQLTASGRRVETQLLTANLASRQTLVVAMTAVRERLRARGALTSPVAPARGLAGCPDREAAARGLASKGAAERGCGTGWKAGSR
jgi:hypothetical protein